MVELRLNTDVTTHVEGKARESERKPPQQISLISSEAIYELRYCNSVGVGDAARKSNGKYNINKLQENKPFINKMHES